MHPTGESHLEIGFIDVDGQTGRLDAGGYFGPGYRGTIDISITDGAIEKNAPLPQTNPSTVPLRFGGASS